MVKLAKRALIAAMMVATAGPALAANPTPDAIFYVDMLAYIKAQFAFDGAEYSAFQSLNLSGAQMKALSDAFASLSSAQLTLVDYLQKKVTVA